MELVTPNVFSAANGPRFKMLDVQGRVNDLGCAEQAQQALAIANQLQFLSGNGKVSGTDPDKVQNGILRSFPLFYLSHNEDELGKHEIAEVARVISQSKAFMAGCGKGGRDLNVTGSRAVAYPETVSDGTNHCVFQVSSTVWYNENRGTANWPGDNDAIIKTFLADINNRLETGKVSFPRG